MTGPPHPDLDALSAAVDGEDAAVTAHAASCPECGPALARLSRVRDLVASEPRPLGDDVIDQLVSTAARSATVTPFSEARRRGPRRPPLRFVAAAAAAIAVVAALPALFGALGGRSADMVATGGGQVGTETLADGESDAMGAGAAEAGAGAAADTYGHAALSGGDLGDQTDPEELARLVAVALPRTGAPSTAAARSSAESEGDQEAPTSTAAARAAAAPTSCEPQARGIGAGRLGRLAYSAVARWRGEPAEVLAFELVAGDGVKSGERQLYVLSRPGCALRAEKRF